ncbi:MAG TPA: response regulator [Pirellulales bacterium]|nr:response regulator [Pirellulales bacterium]
MQHLVTPHSASILLIDDEPDMLDEVSSALAQTGYVCRCCQEPRAAEMMARQILPDLVISDINLGAASGLEICAELKQIEGLANMPVIFLSGAQIPDVVKRAHAAGGAYYLRKPFDPEVLIELVEKALWMPHLVHYAKPVSIA